MPCEEISSALSLLNRCDSTPDGSRVATHCMYPSFDPVYVFVSRMGNGFRVHDGGGAFRCAWLHGRDQKIAAHSLTVESARFHLDVIGESLATSVESNEWLPSAIIGVANASAAAANRAIARATMVAEEVLTQKIEKVLAESVGPKGFRREFLARGKSGKEHRFDFAILPGNSRAGILIDAVAPHHSSISSTYVAFADTDADQNHKFAVYERPLETSDTALLQQVATILPISALSHGTTTIIPPF
jgi:hypothetical protein